MQGPQPVGRRVNSTTKKETFGAIYDGEIMGIYDELQAASEKAYRYEQDAMRAELRIESLKKRIAELEEENEILRGELVETPCDHCGRIFTQRAKGRRGKYCSQACRQKYYRGEKEYHAVFPSKMTN